MATRYASVSSNCLLKGLILLSVLFTLAISKCYGKVRVLFFPRDNSLISRGNSHVSRVRGLVVRCLLFNPEDSCSNPWVCANFFTSIPKQKVLTFFGTMRLFGFVRLFFRNFFNVPKESPFNFSKFCNRMGIKKSQRFPSFTVFGIVRFYKRNNFSVKISRFSQAQHAISDFCFLNISALAGILLKSGNVYFFFRTIFRTI